MDELVEIVLISIRYDLTKQLQKAFKNDQLNMKNSLTFNFL
jgi:hypothetical protein